MPDLPRSGCGHDRTLALWESTVPSLETHGRAALASRVETLPLCTQGCGRVIQTYNSFVVIKKLKRIGNSVGLILPRDLVAAADLEEGDEVTLTLHGRRIVIEPSERRADEREFSSAFEQVLRRHGEAFRLMAEYDRTGRRGRAR